MSEKQQIITRGFIPVMGFGLLRRIEDDPWFTISEYVEALPADIRHAVKPSKSSFTNNFRTLGEAGAIETAKVDGPRGPQRWTARTTAIGETALLDHLVWSTSHEGLSLPQILYLPRVVEVILSETDFQPRLIRRISGQ